MMPDSDEALWSLLEKKEDALAVLDQKGIILKANGMLHRIWSCLDADLAGKSIWALLPPQRVSYYRVLWAEIAHESAEPLQFIEQDGEAWWEISLACLPAAGGAEARILLHARDVTRQTRAEERLKQVSLRLITILEDERRRISQDLHDDIGQRMTGLILNLRGVKNALPAENKTAIHQLDTSIGDLELTIKQLRQIFYQLYPPSLNRMALSRVLSAFCTSFAGLPGCASILAARRTCRRCRTCTPPRSTA
jgi:PAS domain S-box-containing protein